MKAPTFCNKQPNQRSDMSRETPLFVHIIGLEGCGHHELIPILSQAVTETHGGDEYNRFFRNWPRNAFNG